MTPFEYAAIFYGIIVGLALSNILMSFHKLVEARNRVRWHWMAPLAALNSTILITGNFWLWWLARNGSQSLHTFLYFMLAVATLTFLYLSCAATLPDEVPEAGIDLKDYYFANRYRIWGFSAGFYLINQVQVIMYAIPAGYSGMPLQSQFLYFGSNVFGIALCVSLIFVRAIWWHAACLLGGFVGLLLLFVPMRLM